MKILTILTVLLLSACNVDLKKTENGSSDSDDNNSSADDDDDSTTASSYEKGAVFIQKVDLEAGQALISNLTLSPKSASLNDVNFLGNTLEVSFTDDKGVEVKYSRADSTGGEISFTPDASGNYQIILKNNNDVPIDLPSITNSGAISESDLEAAIDRTGPNANIILKGAVVLARQCRSLNAQSNIDVTDAPSGRYFVQPLIFLGQVQEDGTVKDIKDATMTITSGDDTITLSPLAKMKRVTYRDIYASNSSLTDEQERNLTRMFYHGYLSAAGELYTVDTFRQGGDCSKAGTIALSGDVGAKAITLSLKQSELSIDTEVPLRATQGSAFSIYQTEKVKVTDWTQCTYNKFTAKPTTYNGDADLCKDFSLKAPPYVSLDYKLPSETDDGKKSGLTALSDPTRVIYWGYSYAQAYQQYIVDHATELADAAKPAIELNSCLNNGGIVAVPLTAEKTRMPLDEFNVKTGDVISLSSRAGSYTAIPDFYQGDVSVAGEYTIATCIPEGDSSCAHYKLVEVKISGCTIKADSGISVTSFSDSYIYPDFFSISGVVTE